MGVSVRLSDLNLHVVPGEETVCTATVQNTGMVVDQATVDLVGPAAAWSVVDPPQLNLYPGDSGEVRVHFAPPRSPEAPAGVVPFGVRVSSREDPAGSVVEEGTVEVAPFAELRVELLPQISRGARRGRHRLDVANRGNVPVGADVLLADPDDELRFKINRPALQADPGAVSRAKIAAIPRRTFLRGPVETRPFQVMVQPDAGEPVSLEGTFEQRPLVPRWAVTGLVALVALGLVLTTLWFTLLRPAIKSAATEAAAAEASPVAAAAEQAQEQAARAEKKADDAAAAASGTGSDGTAGTGTSTTGGGTTGGTTVVLDRPFDFRIQASAPPRTSGFNIFTSSAQGNRPLDITDLQLQNPAGDIGILQIRRAGTVIFEFGLENFRDYDNHFVVPLHFNAGQQLQVALQCRNPGGKRCTPSVTVGGKTTA